MKDLRGLDVSMKGYNNSTRTVTNPDIGDRIKRMFEAVGVARDAYNEFQKVHFGPAKIRPDTSYLLNVTFGEYRQIIKLGDST